MTEYSHISDKISKEIAEFVDKLRDSGIQHKSTVAFGEIVTHYAKGVIDTEFTNVKYKFVDGEVKLVQEIKSDDIQRAFTRRRRPQPHDPSRD